MTLTLNFSSLLSNYPKILRLHRLQSRLHHWRWRTFSSNMSEKAAGLSGVLPEGLRLCKISEITPPLFLSWRRVRSVAADQSHKTIHNAGMWASGTELRSFKTHLDPLQIAFRETSECWHSLSWTLLRWISSIFTLVYH